MKPIIDPLEIVNMIKDVETIESFLGEGERFVGNTVHIPIPHLAKIIRNNRAQNKEALEALKRVLLSAEIGVGNYDDYNIVRKALGGEVSDDE